MKFSHMADVHLGGWREPRLREVGMLSFESAIDTSLERGVDFILISGDLFNTAIPGIDVLKRAVKKLQEVKRHHVPVYIVAGSHDYSPSGKTMLDVLEEASLVINVFRGSIVDGKLRLKFTTDPKTGVKITGMIGKRGMLERAYYEDLDRKTLEDEDGRKVFLFHTSITELKPKSMENMESSPVSLLPRNFDYYAGGHVHIVEDKELPGYSHVVYPGPVFPNNFRELEELKHGGFYIYDEGEVTYHEVSVRGVLTIRIDADHKMPESVTQDLISAVKDADAHGRIVLMRVEGVLGGGKVSDIDFTSVYDMLFEKGAYFVMRNTVKLKSKDFEEIKVMDEPSEDIEEAIIKEHTGQIKVGGWDPEKELSIIREMMAVLSSEKKEGEKVYEFEDRIRKEMNRVLDTDV